MPELTVRSEQGQYPIMEPIPRSTLSPPWIVVIILITISGADAPKARKDAPATSSFKFIFTHRISRLGTRYSSQIYASDESAGNTIPIIANVKKKMMTSTRMPHQYWSITSKQRPLIPASHHYPKRQRESDTSFVSDSSLRHVEWNNTRFPTGNEDSRQTNPSGEEMAPEETQTMTPIAFLLLATTSQRIVIMRVGVERVERASLQRSLTIPEILPFSAIRFGSFFSWYVHLPPILTA